MTDSVANDSVFTQYPLGDAEEIILSILDPSFRQDKNGLIMDTGDYPYPIERPVNIIFGEHQGMHFFECIENPCNLMTCHSIRFSSELKFDEYDQLLELPDCFYRAQKYLEGYFSGYEEELELLLEGFIVNGVMFNEYTQDIGELDCIVHDLNKSSKKAKNYHYAIPSTDSAKALHKPYLTNGAILKSTSKGTVIANEHGEEICLLTHISCSAFIDTNVPMFKGREIICVMVSIPQPDGSVTEIEFRSFNTLRDRLPDAAKLACQYLQKEMPGQQHLLGNMVIGCIGSVLNDIWDSEFHEKGLHVAMDMFKNSVFVPKIPSLV